MLISGPLSLVPSFLIWRGRHLQRKKYVVLGGNDNAFAYFPGNALIEECIDCD
jgi:hypothetical protein